MINLVELIFTFCENVVALKGLRKNKNRDFYNDFIKDTYIDLKSIHADYIEIMKIIEKNLLHDGISSSEVTKLVKIKRRDLAHIRSDIYYTMDMMKSMYNEDSKKSKDIIIKEYVDSVYRYFHSIVGYPQSGVLTGERGQSYSFTLLNLLIALEMDLMTLQEYINFFEIANEDLHRSWDNFCQKHSKAKVYFLSKK